MDGLEINDKYSFRLGLDREFKSIVVDDTDTGALALENPACDRIIKGSIIWPLQELVPNNLGRSADQCVQCGLTGGGEGLSQTAYTVRHAKGKTQLIIDQSVKPTIDNLWFPLGRFSFDKKNPRRPEVSLSDKGTEGYLIADAVHSCIWMILKRKRSIELP